MDRETDWKIPKYVLLKERIKSLIADKQLEPHAKLPTWGELMEVYKLSDTTVRKAVDELAAEGYLYRIQGKGTFVAERTEEYKQIGLVMPHVGLAQYGAHKFFVSEITETIYSVQEEVRKFGANLILYLNGGNLEIERHDLSSIVDSKLDGAIIFYSGARENIECLERIKDTGIPMVMMDRHEKAIETDHVVTNNYSGAYQAVTSLIENGFAPVYHITTSEDVSTVRDRLQGYRQAMLDHGFSVDSMIRNLFWENPILDGKIQEELARDITSSPKPRVGIFAVNGEALLGLWKALQKQGVAHDRIGLSCFDEPPIDVPKDVFLVKVLQASEEIGRKCVQIVMDKLHGNTKLQRIALEPEVVVVRGEG